MMVLDCNEAALAPELRRALELEFKDLTVSRLACGDLLALTGTGLAIIERKTASDLLSSIADQRVFRQIGEMVDVARFPFLVIHGSLTWTEGEKVVADRRLTGWHAGALEMAMVALQAAGAIVVQTRGAGYVPTVKRLLTWCESADERWVKRKAVHWLPEDAQRDFLAQLPGVGSARVDALMEQFGDKPLIDLLRLVSTSATDLPRLWGNGTVNKIREFLGLHGDQRIEISGDVTEQHDEKGAHCE